MSAPAWFAAGFATASILAPLVPRAGDKTGRALGRWLRRKMDRRQP